ncbi:energy transducer TonB [Acinetobacter haemolyticus]|uniref:energy transducer TonB n=1 Tax=Acinetobacter haemolyticus TaxID=29430 RepID=UPI000D6899DC|nr:energy transducer TonB [Acinetobacter haemolyticus]
MKLKNLSPNYKQQFSRSSDLAFLHLGKWGVGCTVMLLHIAALWLLSHLIEPYRLDSAPKVNALKVHFVSLSSAEQPSLRSSEQSNISSKSEKQNLSASESSNATVSFKPAENTRTLSSTHADRVISDSQPKHNHKNEQATSTQVSIDSEPTLNKDLTLKTKQIEQQLTTKQGPSASQQQGENHSNAGGVTTPATEQELARAPDSQVAPNEPLQVSRVDVLSFAKLSYEDRELKQQDRTVELRIRINENGQATDIQLQKSSGISSLDQRVIQAALKSKFKSYQVNGRAVAVVVDFPVQLKLSRNR